MESKNQKKLPLIAACAVAIASFSGSALAEGSSGNTGSAGYGQSGASTQSEQSSGASSGSSGSSSESMSSGSSAPDAILLEESSGKSASGSARAGTAEPPETMEQVNNAAEVVKQMESDPKVSKLLQQAKGVFIVPQYGRGGLVVGARGGEGVMMAKNGSQWSNPVFYNLGGISIGAQAGAEVGSIAMILMNEKAVKNFRQENKFSLTADAGLTLVNYTAEARGDIGRGDVIVWSDTTGAFASAAVGATDISFDDDENASFYRSKVSAKEILSGKVKSAQASVLTQALSSGGSASGSSGSSGSPGSAGSPSSDK